MTLFIDAIGSLVVPLTRADHNLASDHILLYQMVMNIQ